MSDRPGQDRGVSPLDRAHALRLLGQPETALALACSVLSSSPQEVGAAYLIGRLLLDAKDAAGSALVATLGPDLVQRFTRRGDLGAACLAAQLMADAGAAREPILNTIATAFGLGSARVREGAAMRPPPLPLVSDAADDWGARSGPALLTAATQLLSRWGKRPDELNDSAPLPRLPLFGELAPAGLAKLLGALQVREYAAGQYLVRQGDEGREAFVLARGVVNVVRSDGPITTVLAVLGPSALFGEMALVSDAPRAASVVAVEPAQILVAQRDQLEELAKREPAVGRVLGTFCHQRMVSNLIRHSRILSAVTPDKRRELMSRFTTHTFAPGDMLVKCGEDSGRLFLIASGGLEVRGTDADGDNVILAHPGPGDVVGEISLVLRQPATADVVALHTTVALELTREQFHAAIREHPGLLQQLYEMATARADETRSVVARRALDIADNVLL